MISEKIEKKLGLKPKKVTIVNDREITIEIDNEKAIEILNKL